MSGPTLFAPLLQAVISVVRQPCLHLKYHVLLILTDGAIHDMQVRGGARRGRGGKRDVFFSPLGPKETHSRLLPLTLPLPALRLCPCSVQDTIDALVTASRLPLSVLIVGIGNSPELSKMKVGRPQRKARKGQERGGDCKPAASPAP